MEVTLQELLALLAAGIWALLWATVAGRFGWWAGAGGFAAGGFAGLVLGWCLGEWINSLRPARSWAGAAAAILGAVLALLAFAALPLSVLASVRKA